MTQTHLINGSILAVDILNAARKSKSSLANQAIWNILMKAVRHVEKVAEAELRVH